MTRRLLSSLAFPAAVLAFCAVLSGCQRKGLEDLVSSELFSISLGKMEDQIDLFQFETGLTDRTNAVFMRDGWFYVVNGSSGKIMVFSSYGDLIFLLYNPLLNPAPTILGTPDPAASEAVSTRGSVAYPFADIGCIAVASDRTVYVEDAVAQAREVRDADRGVTRSRVVLRFDRRGRPLQHLGEEGPGGTPFPFIAGLSVTANDELVVVCRLPRSWEVFWFSRDGVPLYQVEVGNFNLPVTPQKGVTPILVTIAPDQRKPLLYLIVYSSNASSDSASQDQMSARAYTLDLRTRQYGARSIEFPRNPDHLTKVGLKSTRIPSPPSDFLGVGNGGSLFLLAYTDTNTYTLQILDQSGRLRAQRRLVIEDSELTFRDIHLSASGIIYGLLADRSRAHVSWWRSDLLFKGG
jgi:hypothetical protein